MSRYRLSSMFLTSTADIRRVLNEGAEAFKNIDAEVSERRRPDSCQVTNNAPSPPIQIRRHITNRRVPHRQHRFA